MIRIITKIPNSPLESMCLEDGVKAVNRRRVYRFGRVDHVSDARQIELGVLLQSQELASSQTIREVGRLASKQSRKGRVRCVGMGHCSRRLRV